jgi:S-adenosylmethionine synthetase
MDKRILTAESITEGHPDKLCDLIADIILDECLRHDRSARVACEVLATAGKITVAGEITVSDMPDLPAIICRTVREIGYDSDYEVEILVHEQSTDIADAVAGMYSMENCSGKAGFAPGDHSIPDALSHKNSAGTGCIGAYTSLRRPVYEVGAGDQGIVYGYAVDETEELLPLPVVLASKLTLCLAFVRKMGIIPGLLPDGKAQVSVEYDGKTPVRIAAVVVSCQHEEDKDVEQLRHEVLKLVIEPALFGFPFDSDTDILINPSGRFVSGGFEADTGLTGRKLMADTYGGLALHGGGALSGKDGTKVDRSGAYMARYAAKNVVAAGLADECTVSAAYAIGRAAPLCLTVDTHGTGVYADEIILRAIKEVFDFRPLGMILTLGLNRPIFANHCCYNHFMKQGAPWEQTDKTEELRELCALLTAPKGVPQ